MYKKVLFSVAVATSLFFSGCSLSNSEGPTPQVEKLIKENQLQVVEFNYVKQIIGNGTQGGAKAILIDARPDIKYKKGTIPSSINIPDTDYKNFVGQLKDVPKDKEIIVYCGGWSCGKSPKVAGMLKKDGFTNVKLYQAGEPEWIKKSYVDVDTIVVKSAMEKNSALLVDARPNVKFLQETIPGSISVPDTEIEKYIGRFPINKEEKIIVFCGGFKCAKSHIVADILVSKGYTNVSVYAGGVPEWKKEGLPTTKNAGTKPKIEKTNRPTVSKNGLKLGSDEGTVDGKWFNNLISSNSVPSNIQIVNVLSADDFKNGHLKGTINIEVEKLKVEDIIAKLPKDKSIVFHCASGARALEAWMKLKNAKVDVSEIFYFDANFDCKGENCKIEVNEPIE